MKIKVKKLHEDAKIPFRANDTDVGYDVFSTIEYTLKPGERYNFPTGFALEFDKGYAAIVKDRSSMANKFGIHALAGVIDPGYRGEYKIELINLGTEDCHIEKNQKIAQILFVPVMTPELEEATELSDSSRGNGGFGSSGKF